MADVATKATRWATVAFGDVVKHVKDKVDPKESGLERYIAGEHMDTDDLRIRRWGDIGDDYLGPAFHMRFKPGHVLYGSRRTYLRKVALADFEGITANTTYVLESKDPLVLLPELLPFIMQTEPFHEHSKRESKGSVNPYVNFSDLAWYEFALPPVEEQRQIARVLQAVSRESHQLFSCLDAVERLIPSYSLSRFSTLHSDEGVPKRQLGELLLEGISNGIFRKKEQFGTGTRMINVTDVYLDFEVPTGDLVRVPVDDGEYESFSAKPGDVIFNRSSLVLSGIGHACLVPDTGEDLVFECHLMRARPNPKELDAKFLCHYALSPHGRQHLLSRAQTTTMTTIGQGDIREMIIPCPDLATQRSVSANLDQLYRAKASLAGRRRQVAELIRTTLEGALANPEGEAA